MHFLMQPVHVSGAGGLTVSLRHFQTAGIGNSGTGGLDVADAVSEFAPFPGQLKGLVLSLVEAFKHTFNRTGWASSSPNLRRAAIVHPGVDLRERASPRVWLLAT